jgi:CRP-like cAMP-binding protein
MIDLALVNWDYVISIVISFIVAAAFMALYNKRRRSYAEVADANEPMIEAVVSEYSRRLKYIEKMIIELRIRIDNLESREPYQYNSPWSKKPSDTDAEFHAQSMMSQQESQIQTKRHITSVPTEQISSVIQPLSSVIAKNSMQDIQNGTIDYVLKLLSERPRTSREIQSSIGRTREHTSRLMKRLYESHLVDRQSNSRPYKYTITEAGRVKINVQPKGDSGFGKENTSHDMMDIHGRLQHNNPEYQ